MTELAGYFYPFNCYPCCCNDCTDCSTQYCEYSAGCGSNNTCSEGSCGNCYNPAYDVAMCKLTNGCDMVQGCRTVTAVACSTIGTLVDYTTGYTVNYTMVADCGPNNYAVCYMNFQGCMTKGAWYAAGHSSMTGGPDFATFNY